MYLEYKMSEDPKRGRPTGTYEVDNDVRIRIKKMYQSGDTLLSIAQKLTEEGVPTARNRQWYQGTVRAILHQMNVNTERYKVPDFIRDQIFDLYQQGMSYNEIAKVLTKQGFKNTRGRNHWHASTISRIVQKRLAEEE